MSPRACRTLGLALSRRGGPRACVRPGPARGDQTARRRRPSWPLYGVAFGAYLVALRAGRRLGPPRARGVAIGVAVVWRVAWSSRRRCSRTTSTARSGRAASSSRRQPLRLGRPARRPSAGRAARRRRGSGVNHKDYTAVYPPLWQLAARVVVWRARLGRGHEGVPGRLRARDARALAAILRRRGLPRERLLILAWSPLALVEIAGSGHNDAFGAPARRAALAALERGRPLLSALARVRSGAQAKLLPGLVAAGLGAAATAVGIARRRGCSLPLLVLRGCRRRPVAQPRRVRRVLALQRDAVRADCAALPATGRGAAALLALVVALALARWRSGRRPPRRPWPSWRRGCSCSATCCPGTRCGCCRCWSLRDSPAALLFTGTVALAYVVYPAWLSGEAWQVGGRARAGVRAVPAARALVVVATSPRSPTHADATAAGLKPTGGRAMSRASPQRSRREQLEPGNQAIGGRMRTAAARIALAGSLLLWGAGTAAAQDLASFEKRVTVKTLDNGLTCIVCERPEAPVFSFFTHVESAPRRRCRASPASPTCSSTWPSRAPTRSARSDYAAEKARAREGGAGLRRLRRRAPAAASGATRRRSRSSRRPGRMRSRRPTSTSSPNEFARDRRPRGRRRAERLHQHRRDRLLLLHASNRFELWAYLESERFLNRSCASSTRSATSSWRSAACAPRASPIGRLIEQFLAAAFTAHPYGQPGRRLAVGPADLLRHRRHGVLPRYYVPRTWWWRWSGDVKAAEVMPIVEKYFGRLPEAPAARAAAHRRAAAGGRAAGRRCARPRSPATSRAITAGRDAIPTTPSTT